MTALLRRRWLQRQKSRIFFPNRENKWLSIENLYFNLKAENCILYSNKTTRHLFWLVTKHLWPWIKHSYKFHKCNDFTFHIQILRFLISKIADLQIFKISLFFSRFCKIYHFLHFFATLLQNLQNLQIMVINAVFANYRIMLAYFVGAFF